KAGGKWDWPTLDHWLKSPKSMAAGTKMTFAGLSDGQERANVIAYLNTDGSNLPLPKAPAAAPAAPADAKADAPKPADAKSAPEAAKK
ncbi:MAG: cytochrome c family protein, partial [Novosphingobium sp.]